MHNSGQDTEPTPDIKQSPLKLPAEKGNNRDELFEFIFIPRPPPPPLPPPPLYSYFCLLTAGNNSLSPLYFMSLAVMARLGVS